MPIPTKGGNPPMLSESPHAGVRACLSRDGKANHCVLWKCHESKTCAHGVEATLTPDCNCPANGQWLLKDHELKCPYRLRALGVPVGYDGVTTHPEFGAAAGVPPEDRETK